jgi:phosphoenolpyruvate phosphomutase
LILVHSRQKTPGEIETFVKAWDGKAPIALVPTAYPQMTVGRVRELKKVALLIWGNHAIRASVGAMRKTFAQIRKDGGIHGVESTIATVEDVFDLQGMAKVKDNEKRFLR